MTRPEFAPPPPEPTQVQHPGKAVARTVFQLIIGGILLIPLIVQYASESGIPVTGAWVVGALALSAFVTRLMANPAINAALRSIGLGADR